MSVKSINNWARTAICAVIDGDEIVVVITVAVVFFGGGGGG